MSELDPMVRAVRYDPLGMMRLIMGDITAKQLADSWRAERLVRRWYGYLPGKGKRG